MTPFQRAFAARVTRPSPGEVDTLTAPLPDELVDFARRSTAPTAREVASLRPRPRASRFSALPALAVVLAAGLAVVALEPTALTVRASDSNADLYVIAAGEEVEVDGVSVRGFGTVTKRGGMLVLEGDLSLVVTDPVTLSIGGRPVTVERALIELEGGRMRIELLMGEPTDATESVLAREVEAEPLPPAPVLDEPPSVEGAAPSPVPSAPASPESLSDPAARGWSKVLGVLESDAKTDAKLLALESFQEAHPGSAFSQEAEALAVQLRASRLPPAAALRALEDWLAANPASSHSLRMEALAASVAREGLHDCAKARPHDEAVAARGAASAKNRATAFLGLCALSAGELTRGRTLLATVDRAGLDPTLTAAVEDALVAEPVAMPPPRKDR